MARAEHEYHRHDHQPEQRSGDPAFGSLVEGVDIRLLKVEQHGLFQED